MLEHVYSHIRHVLTRPDTHDTMVHLREAGLTDELAAALARRPDLAIRMVDALTAQLGLMKEFRQWSEPFHVTIPKHTATIEDYLRSYSFVSGAVKNEQEEWRDDPSMPPRGPRQAELRLRWYDEAVPTTRVIQDIRESGGWPATRHELLAFLHHYPEVHPDVPIIALGSKRKGSGGAQTVLGRGRGANDIRTEVLVTGYPAGQRFLVAMK